MFGLEEHRGKKGEEEFIFELEREMLEDEKYKDLLISVEAKLQKIKEALRTGEEKENFERLGRVLHGYTSLMKVMNRCRVKK